MSKPANSNFPPPPEQQAIRDKCFHPSGKFIEFPKEDVETSIPARFEKIVEQFPNRPALITRNRTLTYHELNQAANRLAHAILAQRGETPEPIALLLEPDSPLLVAIMGVLKAGKICVVLDPSFPIARSAFLLEDSQAGLLITDKENVSLARQYAQDRCRIVDIGELNSGHSVRNPGLPMAPDHFAFLIYTSGSTGQPKGVIQNHRNLLRDSRLYCNGLHICTDDRVALLYSCSASQGLKITFAALLNGAALCPFQVRHQGVVDLRSWLYQEEITIYFSVPVIFRYFVGEIAGPANFPHLRIIQLDSDLVTRRELEAYQKHFSAATILIIRFGTTETGTLNRMFFNVETVLEEAAMPVGYASEDTAVYLLDEQDNEVPFDTVGEIVVESRYVSPGYWRRSDLTQEKFLSEPHGGDKRIYHTGDLGRLRRDGLLYHLGRKDYQLNVRGYRVEAGEIEAVLLAQGNVKEAIVATFEASTGADSDRLIAYIVPFEKPLPSIAGLRRAVREKLPAYMIPSDFVFLKSLPLTPNGKVDRRTLPAPGNARPKLEVAYVTAQSDMEKHLAGIWEEVLNIRPIGIYDNFFDLGGHSLTATQLVSQVIKHFQFEIPFQSLFQSPTVAEMAAVITEHQERNPRDVDGAIAAGAAFTLRPVARDEFIEFPVEEINQSIPDRFEKIVAAHPGRLAVKTNQAELTYAELNQTANRVAHALLARHGSTEEPIFLLLDNGPSMIASIIGVLKAGKIYVPLDPSFPTLRHRQILEDTAASLIVTDSNNLSLAAELAGGKLALVNIDELDRSAADDNPRPRAAPDAPAYILYTSGSTGRPKGVLQNHRNVLHLIMRHTNRARVGSEDRIALLRSFGVHGGSYDTFAALLNGAAILPFDIKRQGLRELAKWLAREQITLCRIGPPPFRYLTQALGAADRFPRLRMLSFSGEPLRGNDIELCRRYFSRDCILVNSYGATEVSSCCEQIIDPEAPIEDGAVPCGTAARDMKIYLLDDKGEEVLPGEIGEIAVQSRYLALGYWQRPELTRANFRPDPDGGEERVYRTGDLGRMLPDGRLVHVGRKDFQLKIRGYRVEAGEVEAALLALGNIKEAVAVARQDREKTSRLIAYLVPDKAPAPTVTALRRGLAERLPEHMIPSTFVFVDTLPLTPNGKVDLGALPEPTAARPRLQLPAAAPRNQTERITAGIWQAVVGVDPVGIHDNFFDLGGNSLLAVQIASRIYDEFHIELALQLMWEAPTVAALARHIDTALLVLRRRGGPALEPAPRSARLPLSFAQQRLWFLNQLEPESPAYNESRAYRLSGFLDVAALQKALDQIIARHEVLRTTFVSVDGNPTQVIAGTRSIELPLIDLSAWSESGREAEARRLLAENVRRPFDLSSDIMLRVMLLCLNEQEHILLAVNHHIAFDGWSSGIFWQELADLYRSAVSGETCELSELPIQYADFAVWQRNRLQEEILQTQLSYWKKQLDGLEPLRLFTDRGRSATATSPGAEQSLTLAKELCDDLKALSRQQGVTLFMTLLAAFQTLLSHYTGQTDIVVGTPIANRSRLEVEELIGFFVNTLVLRTDCSSDPTFRELLQRVKRTAVDAYAHQEVPFEKLVEELQPERNLGSLPLFQVMFRLQNFPRSSFGFPGLALSSVEVANGTAKFDLSLSMREEPDGLKATLAYCTDLFDAATIARMLGHLQVLLDGIVADPDRSISALPILTEPERQQLLMQWNDRKRDYPQDKCIQELFEQQVKRTPHAIAVVFAEQQLTYRELNNRANQLAHYLQKLGVGPEVLVGICLERSLDMIVGLLAILKAGGAYLPLDPGYPKDRLAFMVEDAQVSIILTEVNSAGKLPPSEARVIRLDEDWKDIGQEATENPRFSSTPAQLAYVMYTSGSTGTPKGVEITHRGITRLLFGGDYAQLDANQTLLHLAPAAFDASTFEIWGALLHGGKCVLYPECVPGPQGLGEIIKRQGVTTLWLTASLFNAVIDEAPQALSEVRQLLIGGEALSVAHVRRGLELLPHTEIINGYGPTESTTFACCYRIPRKLEDNLRSVPIGNPIGNTKVYILDWQMNPVPVSVAGELYIGGDGLARGYRNRPELTAERFIYHSFDGEPGQRLYRTGDLARYLSDGNIEFLGRVDNQVKIRGYRIELGEIEIALSEHNGVREAVLFSSEDHPGDKQLVAYVVPKESAPAVSDLREFLKAKLPDYMVPTAFIFLDTLPLTPNGKLDRNALPPLVRNPVGLDQIYVAPSNASEQAIADIWAEILGVKRPGVHDNFFDLGGHSLKATQVVSRLRKALQSDIPLRHMFEFPTIRELAAAISGREEEQTANPKELDFAGNRDQSAD
jgi:amino acid adenylation domain-containing protein